MLLKNFQAIQIYYFKMLKELENITKQQEQKVAALKKKITMH